MTPCPKCGEKLNRDGNSPSGKQRFQCSGGKGCGYATVDPTSKRPAKAAVYKRSLEKTERFIVTAAQNATPVHAGFVRALQTCAKHLGAEILVIPLRYKNPTSRWSKSQANDETWAPEITPYLWNVRKNLNKNLMIMGDIKIQPTASSPLNGFDGITHGESGIFGHTKLQLRSVPTLPGKLPKLLATTGACTVANFTDSRAGKLGEFHQALGALLVEIRGGAFHIRQLNADGKTGEFIDLDMHYGAKARKAPRALALVMGDTHVDARCPLVQKATFGKGGIVETLNPEWLLWHDLLDGESINPHHRGNPFIGVAKRHENMDDARDEVMRALQYVSEQTKGRKSAIVPSNHDDFLQRWLSATDWRTDPTNAEFYLETALAQVRAAKAKEGHAERLSAFGYWAKRILNRPDVKVLSPDESFNLAGIELGLHGDRGPNGARGSIKNLRRIGAKTIVGHSHSPGIDEGCYQVGTSTKLRLGYNSGPSSWLNSHCVVYANGKRSLIHVIGGEWRL